MARDVTPSLGVKIIDVHQTSQGAEWIAAAATRPRRQGQLGQHGWAAQQDVVTGMALHGSPEIGALEGVLILRGAHVGSTEDISLLLENRRLKRLLENGLTRLVVYRGVGCAAGDNDFHWDNESLDSSGCARFRSSTHHIVGILRSAVRERTSPSGQCDRGLGCFQTGLRRQSNESGNRIPFILSDRRRCKTAGERGHAYN